jgi:hypothetical protein
MSKVMTESEVEKICLDLIGELGYGLVCGPDIFEGSVSAEGKYGEVVFVGSLKDALADDKSAKQVFGDKTLKLMAHGLVEMIRKNVSVDWTLRDSVQAKLRVMVRHLLNKYGYPPDKQEKATFTVLEQAKLLCKYWAEVNVG